MRAPAETREFAINASNQRSWEAPARRYVHEEGLQKEPFYCVSNRMPSGIEGRCST